MTKAVVDTMYLVAFVAQICKARVTASSSLNPAIGKNAGNQPANIASFALQHVTIS